jgi:hypothetical protein
VSFLAEALDRYGPLERCASFGASVNPDDPSGEGTSTLNGPATGTAAAPAAPAASDVQSAASAVLADPSATSGSYSTTLLAFQQAYNSANPGSAIGVDGLYGPETRGALLQTVPSAAVPDAPAAAPASVPASAPAYSPSSGAGSLVPRIATPVTAQDVANAIAAAWPAVVGGPVGSAVGVLVATSAFETGRWKSCWNNNVGNVAWSGSGDYYQAAANAQSGVTSAQAPHKWRSYPSLSAAMADWLKIFAQGYPAALAAARQGDVSGFMSGLWQGWGRGAHYFQGDQRAFDQYKAGVAGLYEKFKGLVPDAAQVKAGAVATAEAAGLTWGAYWAGGAFFLGFLYLMRLLGRKVG